MTVLKVRPTNAQINNLWARVHQTGLQIKYKKERDGLVMLVLENRSHAHMLRDIIDSEGIRVVYDADW
jgi:hypothetical protein